MSYIQIVIVLFVHFIADFIFQSNFMAQNKSKNNFVLVMHTTVYTCITGLSAYYLFGFTPKMFIWLSINDLLHFGTDWVTSRMTASLWRQERVHDFFVIIGLDQFIHAITLIGTAWWLLQ